MTAVTAEDIRTIVRDVVHDEVQTAVAPEIKRARQAVARADRSTGGARENYGIRFNAAERAPVEQRMDETGEDFPTAVRNLVQWAAMTGGITGDIRSAVPDSDDE